MRTDALCRPASGFTLLELAVVACIIAVLTAAAIPAWRDYVLRSHRAEARSALLTLGTAQEKHYLRCNSYAAIDPSAATSCDPSVLRFPDRSTGGRYRIDLADADSDTWIGAAIAIDDQASDSACVEFGLSADGTRSARRSDGSENTIECWSR
jgi:type IV pilus assembly protein PilE